jgi:hypothetical protein
VGQPPSPEQAAPTHTKILAQRLLDALSASLGDSRYEAAWQRGRRMEISDAVKLLAG